MRSISLAVNTGQSFYYRKTRAPRSALSSVWL